MITAALSSACCWVPLALVGLGASAGGVGAAVEGFRWPLLALTAAALATGFYLAYRKPTCRPDGSCRAPNRRLRRINRAMLWTAAPIAALAAAFPSYVDQLLASDEPLEAAAVAREATSTAPEIASVRRSYTVTGMSCAGCVSHVREALAQVPEVMEVDVVFEGKRATVHFRADSDPTQHDDAVYAAIDELGYEVSPITEP